MKHSLLFFPVLIFSFYSIRCEERPQRFNPLAHRDGAFTEKMGCELCGQEYPKKNFKEHRDKCAKLAFFQGHDAKLAFMQAVITGQLSTSRRSLIAKRDSIVSSSASSDVSRRGSDAGLTDDSME